MELLAAEIIEGFYTLLPPMIRISAFLLAAPLFSIQAVTVRIRVMVALVLTNDTNATTASIEPLPPMQSCI